MQGSTTEQHCSQLPLSAAGAACSSCSSTIPTVPGNFHGFPASPHAKDLLMRLRAFLNQHVIPADAAFQEHSQSSQRWHTLPLLEQLKSAARTEGLWNLWIPPDLAHIIDSVTNKAGVPQQMAALLRGPRLANVDYAYLAREMGPLPWCPEVFNCSAPDTGNMEVLARYGSRAQQEQWLLPLLRGDMRSCFAMTEPAVASSDATNVRGVSSLGRRRLGLMGGWNALAFYRLCIASSRQIASTDCNPSVQVLQSTL
jgi:alkylation response protein AidB-like acyl-CoA dehydrogenase